MVCHKHLMAFIEIITKLLSLKFCYFFIFRVQLEYSGEYVIWPEFLIIWSLDCVCTRVDNLRFKGHRRKEKAEKTLRFLVNFVFLKHGNASRSLIMLTIEWLLLWSDLQSHISDTEIIYPYENFLFRGFLTSFFVIFQLLPILLSQKFKTSKKLNLTSPICLLP